MKIAFITSKPSVFEAYFPTAAEPDLIPREPSITPDDQLVVNALRKQGHEIRSLIWGCSLDEANAYDLLIFRSPWDYKDTPTSRKKFLEWIKLLHHSTARVFNSLEIIIWNVDKIYLRDLEAQSIPVIPTEYLEHKTSINLLNEFHKRGSFLLKPRISAGAYGLYTITSEEDAVNLQKLCTMTLQKNNYMLQPIIKDVIKNGEWSFIFINHQYSHAVHKLSSPGSIFINAERGGSFSPQDCPSHFLLKQAQQIYEKFISLLNTKNYQQQMNILYVRIDLIATDDRIYLMECECIEPELFFRFSSTAIDLFSAAIESYKSLNN